MAPSHRQIRRRAGLPSLRCISRQPDRSHPRRSRRHRLPAALARTAAGCAALAPKSSLNSANKSKNPGHRPALRLGRRLNLCYAEGPVFPPTPSSPSPRPSQPTSSASSPATYPSPSQSRPSARQRSHRLQSQSPLVRLGQIHHRRRTPADSNKGMYGHVLVIGGSPANPERQPWLRSLPSALEPAWSPPLYPIRPAARRSHCARAHDPGSRRHPHRRNLSG
jgi:hypothetical protein